MPGWHVGAQKTSSYITARLWLPGLIVGPCPSKESLCCPACPPLPLFFADSRPPVSKVACLLSLYLLSTCMYHTFSHITFLGYNHMNSRASVLLDPLLSEHIIRYHMCPWGRLLPGYHTRFFLQRGCCCQGKEVVPVDHIRGKGLSSRLTSGSKIRLTAGFEPCPQGPAPSSFSCSTAAARLSLFMCTLFCAFNTCVSCITFFLGLAASHSSKDPPSLAYSDYLHLPNWTVCAGVEGVALSAKTACFNHPVSQNDTQPAPRWLFHYIITVCVVYLVAYLACSIDRRCTQPDWDAAD